MNHPSPLSTIAEHEAPRPENDTMTPPERGSVAPAVLTREQAADYLAVPRGTLDIWRSRGKGPKYVRLGRSVRYRVSTLDAFLVENEVGGDLA
jgi:excisionase family DNA binding protein